jgi:hypothetical protein
MANYTTSITGGRVSPLIIPEMDVAASTVRYLVYYSDINLASATTATDTVTLTLGTTPTAWVCNSAFAYVSTAFAGTTAMTMIVGTTSITSAFIASTSILTAGIIQASGGMATPAVVTSSTGTTAVTIQALFTNASGGSPSALTAGVLEIFLGIRDLTQFY